MEVHFNTFKFQVEKPVVTIGTFDGVHKGHRSVVLHLIQEAKRIGGESVVVTFEPHPRHIVASNESKVMLINTLSEKIYRFGELGIDHLLIISFTEEFATLSYEFFFKNMLIDQLQIHTLLVGYDHRFGKNREGNFEMLSELCAKYNVKITKMEQLSVGTEGVSSSKIRTMLEEGEVEKASEMLSYNYTMKGKVIHGDHLGRKLGFPTANLSHNNPYKLTPKSGVYAVHVYRGAQKYYGMINVGTRPSVTSRNVRKMEVFIFDFNEEIYGEELRISFIKRTRDERKFESLEALVAQLHRDKESISSFFRERET